MNISVRFGNAPRRRRRRRNGVAAVILAVIAGIAAIAGKMMKDQRRNESRLPAPGVPAPR
jgi:hypothetical protein